MKSRVTLWLLCVLVFAGLASAQSLGSAARKERQRRERNKQQGVAAREYSEAEVFGDDEDEVPDEDDENETEGGGGSSDRSGGASSPPRNRIDIDIASDESEGLADDSRDRGLKEAEWRLRFRDARERVDYAREQKRILDGIHHVEGMKLVDENGNVIVETLDDLRRLVAEASQELVDAEKAVKDLDEEARRAGVPPGWRR